MVCRAAFDRRRACGSSGRRPRLELPSLLPVPLAAATPAPVSPAPVVRVRKCSALGTPVVASESQHALLKSTRVLCSSGAYEPNLVAYGPEL